MATEMVVITDLVTLEKFMQHAIATLGGVDLFKTVSIGNEGLLEIATLFEQDVKPGMLVCTFQVAETPLRDNAAGASLATFACTVMLLQKAASGAQTLPVKMAARNHTWKKMLRLIGLINQAADYYSRNVTEINGQDYEVTFDVFQNKLLPVGKIANAQTQGWLIDIDISIPVNEIMYE